MRSEILELFQEHKGRVFSTREVSKEVDSMRYDRDRTWASTELKKLCNLGLIQAINGCYWIPDEREKNESHAA